MFTKPLITLQQPARRRLLTTLALTGFGAWAPRSAEALQAGEPSRTAQAAALHRAAHRLLDRPIVFDDPLALRILGAERVRALAQQLSRHQTATARGTRAFLVTRSRYAEDRLLHAYAHGTPQYLVLGAGLDTFAYRNPHAHELRVFEVDHPSTQAWKRARLREQGIAWPRTLTFTSIDFEKQSLAIRLREAGFRNDRPVFISWLGVTMYLTREAVMQTLAFVAKSCARGSEIVFDFMLPDAMLSDTERASRAARAQRVANIGEPWISQFDPAALAADAAAMGFSQAEHFGAQEGNARYFAGRNDGFRLRGSSARIMTARV